MSVWLCFDTLHESQTTINTHTHTQGQSRDSKFCLSLKCMSLAVGSSQTKIKTLRRHRKNTQTPHRKAPRPQGIQTQNLSAGTAHFAALKQNLCYDNYTFCTTQTQFSVKLCPSLTILVHMYWQIAKSHIQHSCWGEFMSTQEGVWILASDLWLLMLPNSFQRHTPGRDSDPL